METGKIEKVLIEGILPNGDGGRTIGGDMSLSEIVEGVNSLLERYSTVAYVPNYPRGITYKFRKPINESDLYKE